MNPKLTLYALCTLYPELNRAYLKECRLRQKSNAARDKARPVDVDSPLFISLHEAMDAAYLAWRQQSLKVTTLMLELRSQEEAGLVNSTS